MRTLWRVPQRDSFLFRIPWLYALCYFEGRNVKLLWILAILCVLFGGYHWYSSREIARPPGVLASDEPRQGAITEAREIEKKWVPAQAARFLRHHRPGRIDRAVLARPRVGPLPRRSCPGLGHHVRRDCPETLHVQPEQPLLLLERQDPSGTPWRSRIPHREHARDPGWRRDRKRAHIAPARPHSASQRLPRRGSVAEGWRWRSSLTRTDTGRGASEIIYVESLEAN